MAKPFFIRPLEEKVFEVPEEEIPPTPKSILILEDEVEFALTLREYLESYSYKVTTARNGAEGLRHIMAADFDVIVCDMLMPTLAGDMFYLAVERTKPHLCKRFIFITGHRENPKVVEFLKKVRGITLFKPFQLHFLLENVQMLLDKPQPAPGAAAS